MERKNETMCLICVEFEKKKLTLTEAYRNLGEMRETITPEHALEVEAMLDYEWQLQTQEQDDDYAWWDDIPFGD